MSDSPTLPPPNASADMAEAFNASITGHDKAMGFHFVRATSEEVIIEFDIGPHHLQPYGIVHGGVHCAVIETAASIGAAVYAMQRGQGVVGLENHTSFLKAVRSGKLRATAVPLSQGRSTQVWTAKVVDEKGTVAASGTVRLFTLDGSTPLAGKAMKA